MPPVAALADKLPKFAIGERVFVPSAQSATRVVQVVPDEEGFRYRLAGLGEALFAESALERIVVDGRQKSPVLTPRHQ